MAKHKAAPLKRKAEPPKTVWVVMAGGAAHEITAQDLEISESGGLVFTEGNDLVHAFAQHAWQSVELKDLEPPAPVSNQPAQG